MSRRERALAAAQRREAERAAVERTVLRLELEEALALAPDTAEAARAAAVLARMDVGEAREALRRLRDERALMLLLEVA